MANDTTEPSDSTWADFDAVNKQEQEALEQAYQEVEGWNSVLLNQVAGIEDVNLTLVRKLSDSPDDEHMPGDKMSLKTTNALLYLRPDTRSKLYDQGEPDAVIHAQGDPYTVTGDVPPRTQKLIDDLLASTSATHDTEHSTAEDEIWRGDVAGQPIKIVKIHGVMTSHAFDPTDTKHNPTLSVRIYRDEDHKALGTLESTLEEPHTDEV